MTTDAGLDAWRSALYPRCEPAESCQTCGTKRDTFYRIIRVSFNEEKPCPCPCHRQKAITAYGAQMKQEGRKAALEEHRLPPITCCGHEGEHDFQGPMFGCEYHGCPPWTREAEAQSALEVK